MSKRKYTTPEAIVFGLTCLSLALMGVVMLGAM